LTPPRTFTLEAGRALTVRTESAISTKTAKPGDTFRAALTDAIVDKDWAIAADGATVTGVVVNADPGGRVKGRALLVVALQSLELSDGSVIDIATSSYTIQAKSGVRRDAAKMAMGTAAGAGVGAIVGGKMGAAVGAAVGGGGATGVTLATRGDAAAIRAGAVITFRVEEPVEITRK